MQAVASLVQDDPYLTMPVAERIAARRGRRARMWNPEPLVPSALVPTLDPHYHVMWFYNLVFESEWLLPSILNTKVEKKIPSVVQIQAAVARHFGVTRVDLCSGRRDHLVIAPRQIAIYLCRKLTMRSLPDIGRKFGNRDHTTVIHSVAKIERLLLRDDDMAADIHAIKTAIEAML